MGRTTTFTRLTITVSLAMADRLASIREAHGVSVSALIEHAIERYFEENPPDGIGAQLRGAGISLRRSR